MLEIEFRQNEQFIVCVVKDNGIGREKALELKTDKNKNHKSLGMQVTHERLDTLSKVKGIQISFEITDLKNENGNAAGTQVEIHIPFEID